MSEPEPRSRCFLVYAVAPEGMTARVANDLLNEYIGESGRGLIVSHDHFIGNPHGGFAVFEVGSKEEEAKLARSGPPRGLADHEPPAHVLADRGRVRRTG